jgi:3-oxoacyl-[acyl-carrier-protein] synthase II
MIVGAAEAALMPFTFAGLARMGALSRRNQDPERASRPFDRDREGFVFGEGAAALILEREEDARARGAHIYAELAGGAVTSDAYHVAAPGPTGEPAARAMQGALKSSGISPEEVDYICAHGTGTVLNDVIETKAIKQVFGSHAYNMAISSPKSMVGHLLGAAGMISAVTAVQTVTTGVIPPTINLEHPDPDCDLDYVPLIHRRQAVATAMANGFGFGGQNGVVVLRKY